MNTPVKFPFYLKASIFLIGLHIFISMLYIAQDIILPLIYATILAILISPAVDFLVKKKVNRVVSIALVLSVVFILVGGAIALLASQASLLGTAWPKLIIKCHEIISNIIIWASNHFNVNTQNIMAWIKDMETGFLNNRSAALGVTLTTVGGILSGAVLTPVYIVMILFYQPHLIAFVHRVFGADNDEKVSEILTQTKSIVQSYILGLFAEFVIIAILNSVGLLILRMDYAILLGVIGAVLNVVPIIGGIICVALFVIIALITKSPVYVLYVVGLYTLIQFIDDHYIFPKIVGSRVKLNVLISLIAVILGDALWGIPGMFLAIPLMAIVKLICDRIDSLKNWGFLLGGAEQDDKKIKFPFTIKGFTQGFKTNKSYYMKTNLKLIISGIILITFDFGLSHCKSSTTTPVAAATIAVDTATVIAANDSGKNAVAPRDTATVQAPLTLIVTNLTSDTAPVIVGVYGTGNKFPDPKDQLKEYKFKPHGKKLMARITDLKFNTYALAIYQDVNSNGKIDKNLIGIPTEPYAFSNNYKPTVKAPGFDNCRFDYDAKNNTVTMNMIR